MAVKVGAIVRLKGLEAGRILLESFDRLWGGPLTMGGRIAQDRPTAAPYTVLRTEQPALARLQER